LGMDVGQRLADVSPALAAMLDAKAVQSVWRDFLAGRTGWARPWSLFVLNEWVRKHLDAATPVPTAVQTPVNAAAS